MNSSESKSDFSLLLCLYNWASPWWRGQFSIDNGERGEKQLTIGSCASCLPLRENAKISRLGPLSETQKSCAHPKNRYR